MIEGLHDDPALRDRQYQYIIARLAFRQHILMQAITALYLYEKPKTNDERANARLSLETSLQDADDPGKVMAFAAEHQEILPISMQASLTP